MSYNFQIKRRLLFFIILFEFAISGIALSGDSGYGISLQWIGEIPGEVDFHPSRKPEWVHVQLQKENDWPALQLPLLFRVPTGWRLVRTLGDGVVFQGLRPQAELYQGEYQDLTLALLAKTATIEFDFMVPDRNGKSSQKTFVLSLRSFLKKTQVVSLNECGEISKEYRMVLHPKNNEGSTFFVALSCKDQKDSIELSFFSSDSEVKEKRSEKSVARPVLRWRFSKPKTGPGYPGEIRRFKTIDLNGVNGEYATWIVPKSRYRWWEVSAGTNGTWIQYKEKLGGIAISEWAMTGKLSLIAQLVPQKFVADFTTSYTLFVFGRSSSQYSPVRFWSLNGRIGYRLPLDLGATQWHFLAGWYRWSMSTAGSYGVNPLQGPQVFVQRTRAALNELPYYTYFRFATISDSGEFNKFGNNSLAVGGGVGLESNPNAFFITADIGRTLFEKKQNAMSIVTLSLGISKNF